MRVCVLGLRCKEKCLVCVGGKETEGRNGERKLERETEREGLEKEGTNSPGRNLYLEAINRYPTRVCKIVSCKARAGELHFPTTVASLLFLKALGLESFKFKCTIVCVAKIQFVVDSSITTISFSERIEGRERNYKEEALIGD